MTLASPRAGLPVVARGGIGEPGRKGHQQPVAQALEIGLVLRPHRFQTPLRIFPACQIQAMGRQI